MRRFFFHVAASMVSIPRVCSYTGGRQTGDQIMENLDELLQDLESESLSTDKLSSAKSGNSVVKSQDNQSNTSHSSARSVRNLKGTLSELETSLGELVDKVEEVTEEVRSVSSPPSSLLQKKQTIPAKQSQVFLSSSESIFANQAFKPVSTELPADRNETTLHRGHIAIASVVGDVVEKPVAVVDSDDQPCAAFSVVVRQYSDDKESEVLNVRCLGAQLTRYCLDNIHEGHMVHVLGNLCFTATSDGNSQVIVIVKPLGGTVSIVCGAGIPK